MRVRMLALGLETLIELSGFLAFGRIAIPSPAVGVPEKHEDRSGRFAKI